VRKTFTFALQALLEERKHLEDAAQHALAVRLQAYDLAVLERDRLEEELRRRQRELPIKDARLRVAVVQLHDAHLQTQRRAWKLQMHAIAELRDELNVVRQAAMLASRQRHLIETLRNRKMSAFLAAQTRAEQNELDETNALSVRPSPFDYAPKGTPLRVTRPLRSG
jgi:flagellar biosynthesis chaperone FliJ